MKAIKEIEVTIQALPANPTPMDKIQALKVYWPVIRLVLTFIKLFTGSKTDSKINEIIAWGDAV